MYSFRIQKLDPFESNISKVADWLKTPQRALMSRWRGASLRGEEPSETQRGHADILLILTSQAL
jgi:hypothetical protein